MNTCKRCGHVWESRVKHPASCPRCKSYAWEDRREAKSEAKQDDNKRVDDFDFGA